MRVARLVGPKLMGRVALAALAVAALAGGAWLLQGGHANHVVSTTTQNGDGTRTDYVGYAADSFSPTAGYDAATATRALHDWQAAHPGAQILEQTPLQKGGLTIGYTIHYR